jgi:hypothetical protein
MQYVIVLGMIISLYDKEQVSRYFNIFKLNHKIMVVPTSIF